MQYYTFEFSGTLLERGFWLYVWQIITEENKAYYYVGRTGDSSSINPGSPFTRLSNHLNNSGNAKGNSLLEH